MEELAKHHKIATEQNFVRGIDTLNGRICTSNIDGGLDEDENPLITLLPITQSAVVIRSVTEHPLGIFIHHATPRTIRNAVRLLEITWIDEEGSERRKIE